MSIEQIEAHTLKQWLAAGEAVVLDVRTPAEFASEHIEGAIHLEHGPSADLSSRFAGKKLVFQCGGGGRSQRACEAFRTLDDEAPLYNLAGGIRGWKAAGLPTASYAVCMSRKKPKRTIPLERQVMLAVGLLLMLLTVLIHVVNPQLYLLVGLIGAGLTVAGLTGFCGLAILLSKMPWNR